MGTNSTAKPITATFDPGTLASMDVTAREALYEACHLAASALHGVMLQPRCDRSDVESRLNPAGIFIAEMVEFFSLAMDVLVKAERGRKEADPMDNERHLFLLLRHEARMVDDLATLAAMASQFVVEQQNCEWAARHGRKAVAS